MAHTHRYQVHLGWRGSTAGGYRSYDRAHAVTAATAGERLELSADAAFLGDPGRLNPEQLLLAAASSCQLLSFLAEAARAGVDVRSYRDEAEAEMPVSREPMRITRITLRPHIGVAPGTDPEVVIELVHRGHRQCFIANTLNADIALEPSVVAEEG